MQDVCRQGSQKVILLRRRRGGRFRHCGHILLAATFVQRSATPVAREGGAGSITREYVRHRTDTVTHGAHCVATQFTSGRGTPITEERTMLETIVVILLILWLLGLVSSYTMGGFIHILLVVAIVVILLRVIRGRGI
jgi:hypothetical protein